MKTGILWDDLFLKHDTGAAHPESKERLLSIRRGLDSYPHLEDLKRLGLRPATETELRLVHPAAHIRAIQQSAGRPFNYLDPDTAVCEDSYEVAIHAVGGILQMIESLMSGEIDNGFAFVRPPGHHAEPERAMGFCLFGNVAAAARHAQQKHGAERVLIVDFDVHHGNGTEEMFYDDPSVLFISIHQFPHYPFSGSIDEVGSGPGEGFNVNLPFPDAVGDAGYLAALRQLVDPLAREFRPDALFLSAGFDGHWMDPLSGHRLSVNGYAALVEELLALAEALCGGRLICTLEGGYDLNALPHCILSTLRVLSRNPVGVSDPFGAVEGNPRAADKVISAVKRRLGIR